MIFAVASDPQTSCFDRGKTESNGFAQSSGVDVRDPILIADSAVRKVEPLAGNVAIGIWCVVSV